MNILVTGGAGYIGSHTCVELLQCGHEVHILDNFCNADRSVVTAIANVAGRTPGLYEGDIRDPAFLNHVFSACQPDAVIHFAALKSVGESWSHALDYYETNVAGTIQLLRAMETNAVNHLVFSSSATVYGEAETQPITEDARLQPTNPYGRTKLMSEEIILDHAAANPGFCAAVLRYFNPAGAHPSGRIGEKPEGIPSNLLPFVSQVAAGIRSHVEVFGTDYPTADGTGVRDYIHVVDLAEAHVQALEYLARHHSTITVNVGTGRGYSVREVIDAFQSASATSVPFIDAPRRPGDVATCFADPGKAHHLLGWSARRDLDAMCEDAWRWQRHLMDSAL